MIDFSTQAELAKKKKKKKKRRDWVWIGSLDKAQDRWNRISTHIKKLFSQWSCIQVSARNRVIIAKALLLSRCYYLMDGNSIPPRSLHSINNRILRFVRGRNSMMPYSFLEAPILDGGLNCPSLKSRKLAYDLKFLGDLISGDPSIPWK